MKAKSRSIIILIVLFGYIVLQFLWWEILLVKQNDSLINEKQKLTALSNTDPDRIGAEIAELQKKKETRTFMIVGEGTVFLLLLLFGVFKIKQAMDKENALNTQQNNFFLSITHELKTPIAATKLQLQTLEKPGLDEVTKKHLISNALKETERLNGLINNILFASRLESEEFIFQKQHQNLAKLTGEVLKRYYGKELASGEVTTQLEENVVVNADAEAVRSVVINLVENALKYSPGKKNVLVSLQRLADRAVLCVRDEGSGVALEDREKIFQKFYRAGNEETRKTRGSGLGLYIVDYIVRRHDGLVSVTSNKDNGSIFEVSLHVV
jgi:signal transduction histidine kinase